MKIWAVVIWAVAAVIAGLAHHGSGTPAQVSWTLPGPELALGLSPVAVQSATDAKAQVADHGASPKGCARLGIFPDAAWAGRVATRLSAGREAWQVKSYPGERHYVEFQGTTRAALGLELARQRADLKGLVSRQARVEACP